MRKRLGKFFQEISGEKLFFALFLLIIAYAMIALSSQTYSEISISNFFIVVFVSALVYLGQKKLPFYSPFIAVASFLLLISYWNQMFVQGVNYSALYFAGFAFFVGSMVYAIQHGKHNLFRITVLVFVIVSSLPIILPQVPVGDEALHLEAMESFESGKMSPAQFGEHHYLNVSPYYFFGLVALSKTMGLMVGEVFYFFKIAFVLLVFLSFYLLAGQFSDKRLGALVALLAYFPIRLEHFAPQLLGKFLLLNVFIYTYLKYFRFMKSRLLLLLLIIVLVYVNITTLYISFAVFSFLVLIFFFQRLAKKKAYLTDIAMVCIFVVLIFTHLASINFFELDFFQEVIGGNRSASALEGPLVPKGAETIQGLGAGAATQVAEETIPSRFSGFFRDYIQGFGLTTFFVYLLYQVILLLLVLVLFFKLKENKVLAYYSFGFIILVLFLIVVGFRDGVHATLLAMSLVFYLCIAVVFSKKTHYLLPLVFIFLAFSSMPFSYSENQPRQIFRSFQGMATSTGLFGEKTVAVPLNKESVFDVWSNSKETYLIGCSPGRPYTVYFKDKTGSFAEEEVLLRELRCDSLGRLGRIGLLVYSDPLVNGYAVKASSLARTFSAGN